MKGIIVSKVSIFMGCLLASFVIYIGFMQYSRMWELEIEEPIDISNYEEIGTVEGYTIYCISSKVDTVQMVVDYRLGDSYHAYIIYLETDPKPLYIAVKRKRMFDLVVLLNEEILDVKDIENIISFISAHA